MADNEDERDESEMDDDNESAIDELRAKLKKARKDLRDANAESAARRIKLQEYEGATVLKGDDAEAWKAYQALGKPAEIEGKLTAAATTEAELTSTKRRTAISAIAQIEGWKPSVLEDRLDKHPDLTWEVKEQDGKKVVTFKEGDTSKGAAEYAQEKWADFIPALTAKPLPDEKERRERGTRWTPQPPGGGGANTAPVKEAMDKRYGKGNTKK